MPPAAIALVLAAALLHAAWNIVAKKSNGGAPMMLLTSLFAALLWSPLGIGVAWHVIGGWGVLEWALIVASGLAHWLYFSLLLRGYRESDLTVVYPVARGTGPLLSSFAALLLLDESMAPWAVAGVFGITGGVFLIAGGPRLLARVRDPGQARRVRLGVGYGAATGFAIATYTLVDGYAVKVALITPILVDYFGNLARIPLMLRPLFRNRPDCLAQWRLQWRHALVVALLSPLAYILVLYAAQIAPLSHVAPAREVSMLFAALLGGHLLGEVDRGWRVAGAALIGAGVAGLAIG